MLSNFEEILIYKIYFAMAAAREDQQSSVFVQRVSPT